MAPTGKTRYACRHPDEELFTRLIYYGVVQLNFSETETWLMPIGKLLDFWECHKQFNGLVKPKREWSIDEVVPNYI